MVSTRPLTADDLYQLGSDAHYELIEGELIEVSPQGRTHGRILANLTYFLKQEMRVRPSGELLVGDVGFILARNPDTVLAPDLAYVAAERLIDAGDGYLELAPNIAIEVISPSNIAAVIARKIEIYLAASVTEVWVVRPCERKLVIQRSNTPAEILRPGDTLESTVLPKLSLPIEDVFS